MAEESAEERMKRAREMIEKEYQKQQIKTKFQLPPAEELAMMRKAQKEIAKIRAKHSEVEQEIARIKKEELGKKYLPPPLRTVIGLGANPEGTAEPFVPMDERMQPQTLSDFMWIRGWKK